MLNNLYQKFGEQEIFCNLLQFTKLAKTFSQQNFAPYGNNSKHYNINTLYLHCAMLLICTVQPTSKLTLMCAEHMCVLQICRVTRSKLTYDM